MALAAQLLKNFKNKYKIKYNSQKSYHLSTHFLPGQISAVIPFCLFAKPSLHFKVANKVVKRVAMGTHSLATLGSPATCQAVARAELSITSEGLVCMPGMLVGLRDTHTALVSCKILKVSWHCKCTMECQ